MGGTAAHGNQPFPPNSPQYDADHPVEARDVEAAKALMAEAGCPDGIDLEVQIPNTTVPLQLMQVVQSMVAGAGIRLTITSREFATLSADQTAGDYVAGQICWSGRVDPDGSNHPFATTGGGINDSGYSNPGVDAAPNAARNASGMAERKALYDVATDILIEDLPRIFLCHEERIWALDAAIEGFVPSPGGMIRLRGVTMGE